MRVIHETQQNAVYSTINRAIFLSGFKLASRRGEIRAEGELFDSHVCLQK